MSQNMPLGKLEEIKSVWNWNGTHGLLVCADDVNLLGDSINTIKENTETHLEATKDVGLYDYVSSSEIRTEPEHKDSKWIVLKFW